MTRGPWDNARSIRFTKEEWEYLERQKLLHGIDFSKAVKRCVARTMESDEDLVVLHRERDELEAKLRLVASKIESLTPEYKRLMEERGSKQG